jgi:hypothetical protein
MVEILERREEEAMRVFLFLLGCGAAGIDVTATSRTQVIDFDKNVDGLYVADDARGHTLTRATLSIADIQLDEMVIDGPFAVELVSGASEPPLADVRVPRGNYANARLDVTAVDLELDDATVVSFDVAQPFIVRGRDVKSLQFVVDDWLRGVDLARCDANCTARIEQNMRASINTRDARSRQR